MNFSINASGISNVIRKAAIGVATLAVVAGGIGLHASDASANKGGGVVNYECNGIPATIVSSTFGNSVMGTEGNDVIYVLGVTGKWVYGLGGDDVICGSFGNDTIWGGEGNDVIFGQYGDDNLFGNEGDDYIQGNRGDDDIEGGDGIDQLLGNLGNDELSGGDDGDFMWGGNGEDYLWGGNGVDVLYGGNHRDLLFGGVGDDWMYGEAGNDDLWDPYGYNIFDCGAGSDGAGTDGDQYSCEVPLTSAP